MCGLGGGRSHSGCVCTQVTRKNVPLLQAEFSLRAGHWANLQAVRMILPTWFDHLEERCSCREIHFKMACYGHLWKPVANQFPSCWKPLLNKTPAYRGFIKGRPLCTRPGQAPAVRAVLPGWLNNLKKVFLLKSFSSNSIFHMWRPVLFYALLLNMLKKHLMPNVHTCTFLFMLLFILSGYVCSSPGCSAAFDKFSKLAVHIRSHGK